MVLWRLLFVVGLTVMVVHQLSCNKDEGGSDAGVEDADGGVDLPPCVAAQPVWKEIWQIEIEDTGIEGVTPDINLMDVWGSASDDIYVVGNQGTILHYDGTSWTLMESPTDANLGGVWGYVLRDSTTGLITRKDVFAVGDNGTILRYNGTAWQLQRVINDPDPAKPDPQPVEDTFHDVWGIPAAGPNPDQYPTVIAVGSKGLIVKYDGPTNTFLELREAVPFTDRDGNTRISYQRWSPERLGGLFAGGEQDFIAVGNNGTILEFDGTTWNRTVLTGFTTHLNGVWGPGSWEVFAVGLDGTVLRRQSVGSWEVLDLEMGSKILRSLWGFTQTKCGDVPDGGTDPTDSSWAVFVGWEGTVMMANQGLVCPVESTPNRLEGIWGTLPRSESERTKPDGGGVECDPIEIIITGVNGTLIRLTNAKGR